MRGVLHPSLQHDHPSFQSARMPIQTARWSHARACNGRCGSRWRAHKLDPSRCGSQAEDLAAGDRRDRPPKAVDRGGGICPSTLTGPAVTSPGEFASAPAHSAGNAGSSCYRSPSACGSRPGGRCDRVASILCFADLASRRSTPPSPCWLKGPKINVLADRLPLLSGADDDHQGGVSTDHTRGILTDHGRRTRRTKRLTVPLRRYS